VYANLYRTWIAQPSSSKYPCRFFSLDLGATLRRLEASFLPRLFPCAALLFVFQRRRFALVAELTIHSLAGETRSAVLALRSYWLRSDWRHLCLLRLYRVHF